MPLNKGTASKQKCIPGDRPQTSNIVAANRKKHLTIAVGLALLLFLLFLLFLLMIAFSRKSRPQTTATPLVRSSTTATTSNKQRGRTHYRAPKKEHQRKSKSSPTLKKRKTHKKPFPWGAVILTVGGIAFVCLLGYFLLAPVRPLPGKGDDEDSVNPEGANVRNSMSQSPPPTSRGNGGPTATDAQNTEVLTISENEIPVYFYFRAPEEKGAPFDLLFRVFDANDPNFVFIKNGDGAVKEYIEIELD